MDWSTRTDSAVWPLPPPPPLIDPTAIPCRWAPKRTKQLSMAATAGVIRLYASVRYWPYRGVGTCVSLHNLVSFPLPLNIALYIYLCIDIQFGKKLITIQRHCNFFSIGWPFKSKVCYDKYGCFDRHPNLLVRLPQEPSKLGTSFLLFTRKNSQTAKIIDDSDVNKLRDSFFEISRRTIFLIHGFTGKIQLLLIIKLIKLNIYWLSLGVVSSGGSRGGAPFIFRPNWGAETIFLRPPSPPPYLRV